MTGTVATILRMREVSWSELREMNKTGALYKTWMPIECGASTTWWIAPSGWRAILARAFIYRPFVTWGGGHFILGIPYVGFILYRRGQGYRVGWW